MIGGVAGGLAARLDIDPLIVRGAFVVLAIAGGGGILLYLLGWVLLPEDGAPDSIAGQTLGARGWDTRRTRQIIIAGLIALAFFTVIRPWHGSFGRPIVAVAALAAIVAFSRHRRSPTAPPTWGPGFHGPGGGTPANPFPGPPGGHPAAPYPGPAGSGPASPYPGAVPRTAGGTATTPFLLAGRRLPLDPHPRAGDRNARHPAARAGRRNPGGHLPWGQPVRRRRHADRFGDGRRRRHRSVGARSEPFLRSGRRSDVP